MISQICLSGSPTATIAASLGGSGAVKIPAVIYPALFRQELAFGWPSHTGSRGVISPVPV